MSFDRPDKDGFYHPGAEEAIRELILLAGRRGEKIRVRGSGHSVREAIHAERGLNLYLDRMSQVRFDDATKRVTVEAGCHLGRDPLDLARVSTVENSLFYQLDRRGWAFPDTGGIIHQTVGGFLSTGSSGGSLVHSVSEQIRKIHLLDGEGNLWELSPSSEPDLFHAAGVSFGLLGIITAVEFECVERYDIIGEEAISPLDQCGIDLFGNGSGDRPSLQRFFEEMEHARLLWWPQKGAERIVVWKGRRMKVADYTPETGGPGARFRPKPYEEFVPFLGSQVIPQFFGSLYFDSIRYWNAPGFLGNLTRFDLRLTLPGIINAFLPYDKHGPQRFWDAWWKALPMDNRTDDHFFPTQFTEMWLPISRTQEAMSLLRDHFRRGGLSATGTYACEIYPTKRSRFWLSPAYEQDVVKIDMFWYGRNKGNPAREFYPQFWALLKDLGFRLHWGKHLSLEPETGPAYLARQYPRWNDFLKIRDRLDPGRVFLTEYWRERLGL